MKKSEEIKKIVESVSQEEIKRKIKNRQLCIFLNKEVLDL